jgi:hypothetical protein
MTLQKVEVHHEAEQLAKNKCEFDLNNRHCKALKTTIEGLGMITEWNASLKFVPMSTALSQPFLILMEPTLFRFFTACASKPSTLLKTLISFSGMQACAIVYLSYLSFFEHASASFISVGYLLHQHCQHWFD